MLAECTDAGRHCRGALPPGVVDAYDSMTNDRPYRKAISLEEAAAILREGALASPQPSLG
jgi:hypothetical protein